MRRNDLACLGIIVLGAVLFLYGANFYDATVGWVGVYLFFGGIVFYLALYVYGMFSKRGQVQKS